MQLVHVWVLVLFWIYYTQFESEPSAERELRETLACILAGLFIVFLHWQITLAFVSGESNHGIFIKMIMFKKV